MRRTSTSIGAPEGGSGSANAITGNTIGTSADGLTSLGRSGGIVLFDAPSNQIGGTGENDGNLIAGVGGVGITIQGAGATGNLVQGNSIGPDANGEGTLSSQNGQGVFISAASGNTIGGTSAGAGNVIAFNGNANAGVVVTDRGGAAAGNSILGNSIYSNANLGIDLAPDTDGISYGPTANDGADSRHRPEQSPELPDDRHRRGHHRGRHALHDSGRRELPDRGLREPDLR